MMQMTIKSKIVTANLIIFGILISGLAYFVYSRTAQAELDAVDLRLEACAAKIITEFEDEWEEEKEPEWDDILLISAEGLTDVSMAMRTLDGRLVFGVDSLQLPSNEQLRVIRNNKTVVEIVNIGGLSLRRVVYPVGDDGEVEFTLTLITSIGDSVARLNRLALVLFGSVLMSLIVASAAVLLVTRAAFRPLSAMVETAEQISADQLGKRLRLSSQADEVARLGKTLNEMMDRIEVAFKSQRQFVTDASHELRTPLTVIIAELEFIQGGLTNDTLKANMSTALGELDRLNLLVDQLLTLARLDAGRLVLDRSLIRFDETVIDCVQLLKHEAQRRKIGMQVNIDGAVEIDADPIKIKSIVLNLLDNAISYNRSGGTVSVHLREIEPQLVQLTISDTGPGIPAKERSRVFDRFYRGSKSRAESSGSGLGMAIAKELVELHGGRIEIDENQDGGALLRVVVPVK